MGSSSIAVSLFFNLRPNSDASYFRVMGQEGMRSPLTVREM